MFSFHILVILVFICYSHFNLMPYLFNVASEEDPSFKAAAFSEPLNWALAGTSGAETVQHIDAGGCSTVVHVLSGKKLWIIGKPDDRVDFTNNSSAFQHHADNHSWDGTPLPGMVYEAVLLNAADTL